MRTNTIKGHSIWARELLDVVLEPEPWAIHAACRGVAPEVFFPERDGFDRARTICGRCPVLVDCRRWNDRAEAGLRRAALFGVYGGESPGERIARRRG